jgi:curved DNA-binding protein CbpA
MLTWYDVLGVSPGASPGQVRSAYQAWVRQLAPQMLAGAPTTVLKAADVPKAAADEAWRVLGDPAARPLYDSQIGARGNGEGLDQPDSDPSGPRHREPRSAGQAPSLCRSGTPPRSNTGSVTSLILVNKWCYRGTPEIRKLVSSRPGTQTCHRVDSPAPTNVTTLHNPQA